MSWKNRVRTTIARAIVRFWVVVNRMRSPMDRSVDAIKKIMGSRLNRPATIGITYGVVAGFLGMLFQTLLPSRSLEIPAPRWVVTPLLVGMLFFTAFIFGRLLWGYDRRGASLLAALNLMTMAQFILFQSSLMETGLWPLMAMLGVSIAVQSILAIGWLWNTLPEAYQKLLEETARDPLLRQQVANLFVFASMLIGGLAIMLLFFYSGDLPSEEEFVLRARTAVPLIALTWILIWGSRWGIEVVRYVIGQPNTKGFLTVVSGLGMTLFGAPIVTAFYVRSAGWIYPTLTRLSLFP